MKTEPTHKIAIEVKFLGATNSRGPRISLRLPRWKRSKQISYRHECNSSIDGAIAFLAENDIHPDTLLDMDSHYALAVEWNQRPAIFKAFGMRESQ